MAIGAGPPVSCRLTRSRQPAIPRIEPLADAMKSRLFISWSMPPMGPGTSGLRLRDPGSDLTGSRFGQPFRWFPMFVRCARVRIRMGIGGDPRGRSLVGFYFGDVDEEFTNGVLQSNLLVLPSRLHQFFDRLPDHVFD